MGKESNPPRGIYGEQISKNIHTTYVNIQDWRPVSADLGNPRIFPYGLEGNMLLIPAYFAKIEQVGRELAREIDLTEEKVYVIGESFGLRVRYRYVQELHKLADINSVQHELLSQAEMECKASEESFAEYLSQFAQTIFRVDTQLDDPILWRSAGSGNFKFCHYKLSLLYCRIKTDKRSNFLVYRRGRSAGNYQGN